VKKVIFLCLFVLFIWMGWSAQAFAQNVNLYSAPPQKDRIGLERTRPVANYIRSKGVHINSIGTSERVTPGTILMEDANDVNTSDHVDISDQLALGRKDTCGPQTRRIDFFMQSLKIPQRFSQSETIVVDAPPPPPVNTTIIVRTPPPPPPRQTIVMAGSYYPYSYGYYNYNYGYYNYRTYHRSYYHRRGDYGYDNHSGRYHGHGDHRYKPHRSHHPRPPHDRPHHGYGHNNYRHH